METFLASVLQNLLVLMPFTIIRTYQMGVRWSLGKNPKPLGAGWHWKVWLYHGIEISDVVDEVIELPIQSVITKDEKLVCFNANIGYRITDIVKHWHSVQDFHESTRALAMSHLAEKVREKNLTDLVGDIKKLETSLRGTLTTRFKDWGTEVFHVGFPNFAEVPNQVRLFSDSPHSQLLPLGGKHE